MTTRKLLEEMGINPVEKIDNNCDSYWTLHELINHCIEQLSIPHISNWVAIKDALPTDDKQVFVKYENGKYGINEWWENDNCWKYNFENMIVKEWCKPPC